MIILKQNSYEGLMSMEEILEVDTIDNLNEGFHMMGYRFKGKPRKAAIAKGIMRYIKEEPREVLQRLDATSLRQVKELMEKGKGNAIVLDGMQLYNPLQKMHLVLSYEDVKGNKTHMYLFNDLYDIFSPVINDIDIVEEDEEDEDETEDIGKDEFDDCMSTTNSHTLGLIKAAKSYSPKQQAVIILIIDTIASVSPMKMPFFDFPPYEDDINTLYKYIRQRKSDYEIGGITDIIFMDMETVIRSYVGTLKEKDVSFDDAYDMFGYMLFDMALENILQRFHKMMPTAIDAMLKFKRVAGGEIEFGKIGEMAREVFDDCTAKLLEASTDAFDNQMDKKEKQRKESAKRGKSQKVIFPMDWLATRTYTTMNDIDKQYLSFANTVYDILERHFHTIPSLTRKMVAIAIASYIEDQQSNLGLFSSYVSMTRRESENKHPFAASFGDVVPIERMQKYIDEYADDKVNIIDVAYLLAQNSTEFADQADRHFKDAELLLQILEANGYKSLPSNDEYFDDLCDLVELNGWQGLKTFLLWLFDKGYFLSPMTATLAMEDSTVEEVQKTYGTSSKNLVQACKIHNVFNKGLYRIGIRSVTFAEEFARRAELDAKVIKQLGEVEVIEPMMYKIQSVSSNKLTLLDMTGEKFEVSIDKGDRNAYSKNYTVCCKLVKYGDTWHSILPPRILHRRLSEDERKEFRDEMKNAGEGVIRHR